MTEVWLKANQRVMISLMAFSLILAGVCLAVGILAESWFKWLGWGIFCLCGAQLLLLAGKLRRPVLARQDDELLVYLRSGQPERVPLEYVEVFFRGQGPIDPAREGEDEGPNANNIVVRLADRAADWKHRDVQRLLGHWCDGYITIRGMWCERIDVALMDRLNKLLVGAHRERKKRAEAGE